MATLIAALWALPLLILSSRHTSAQDRPSERNLATAATIIHRQSIPVSADVNLLLHRLAEEDMKRQAYELRSSQHVQGLKATSRVGHPGINLSSGGSYDRAGAPC